MTQLTKTASPSAGKPARSARLTWSDFVGRVLELTVEAYLTMRREKVARPDWEENTFTLRLENHLRPIAFDYEFPIWVQVRAKVHTPEMRDGQQRTSEAREIDMAMFGSWERDYHETRFVWEAKRVGDKRVNSEFSRLNSEYVNEGIYRFVKREYARDLPDAGMLGYVLAGNVENIVSDINECMGRLQKNPRLPSSNRLRQIDPIGKFPDSYWSKHTRVDHSPIQLYHLFLTFEFTQVPKSN